MVLLDASAIARNVGRDLVFPASRRAACLHSDLDSCKPRILRFHTRARSHTRFWGRKQGRQWGQKTRYPRLPREQLCNRYYSNKHTQIQIKKSSVFLTGTVERLHVHCLVRRSPGSKSVSHQSLLQSSNLTYPNVQLKMQAGSTVTTAGQTNKTLQCVFTCV